MLLLALLLVFIGVAIGLAWFFIAHDRGAKEPVSALWLAAGLGLGGGILAGILENWLAPVNNLSSGKPYGTLLVAALAVGAIEEACKFLPLAFALYKRSYFNEHTDGVIYFALAGLGFGLPENLLYTLQFGTKAGLVRILMTPFFHAATTGLVGYYLIKFKLAGKSPFLAAIPLGAIMVLHGLYDFGLLSGSPVYIIGSLIITLGLSIGLFMAYVSATELDQQQGLSGPAPGIPSYTQITTQQKGEKQAWLSLLFGIGGIVGALFFVLLGLVLGLAGIVMGTIARSSRHRRLSTAGLVLSGIAVLISLAAWVYIIQQDPTLVTH
jgi:RsiW-degrading membrane proteinase PrsW (M82 family)